MAWDKRNTKITNICKDDLPSADHFLTSFIFLLFVDFFRKIYVFKLEFDLESEHKVVVKIAKKRCRTAFGERKTHFTRYTSCQTMRARRKINNSFFFPFVLSPLSLVWGEERRMSRERGFERDLYLGPCPCLFFFFFLKTNLSKMVNLHYSVLFFLDVL